MMQTQNTCYQVVFCLEQHTFLEETRLIWKIVSRIPWIQTQLQVSRPVCVDVPSETEAVVGNPMKLTCISCMKREEVSAETRVDWYYISPDDEPIPIYLFDGHPRELEGPWRGRLVWNGSKDLQELSISILNVTMNDTGTYNCVVFRQFEFDSYSHSVTKTLVINLVVREEGTDQLCTKQFMVT
nr:sodium channel subunit beta-3-like isoform X5 [Oncorhynchus nerka]